MPRKNKIAVIGDTVSNELLSHGPGRKAAIASQSSFGFQCVHTPFQLASSMINFIEDLSGKFIRVIFNLEFLEILFEKNINMSLVQYVGDTERECRIARLLYGVDTVLADEDAWKQILDGYTNIQETFMAKMNKAADVTFTNPPYNGGLDLKIIRSLKEAGLLKKLVCVHPSTWLVDVKTQTGEGFGPLTKAFRDIMREHITRVVLFNGNPVFNIALFVPCVITEADFSRTRIVGSSVKVKDVGCEEFREVFDIDDITIHGKNWDPTVKEFLGRVRKFIVKNGSLWKNRIDTLKIDQPIKDGDSENKWALNPARIRGHVATDTMIAKDFYTFVGNNAADFTGIRKLARGSAFVFTSKHERNNFHSYLKTDFSRLCLSLVKIKADIEGEYRLVPWLDFSQEWTDDKLFSLLGYPKGHALREYAKTFLPDYHGIYTNGKTY